MLKQQKKKRTCLIIGFTLVLGILLAFSIHNTVKTRNCALCGGPKYHAPCLVDLSTGEVGELTIYTPHPTLVGEISEAQTGGFIAFLPCAGLTAIQDGDSKTCSVQIPDSQKKLNPQYFCRPCQELLAGANGYILADLHDLEQIRVYSIQDDTKYTVRGYGISIEWDEKNEIFMMVNGPCTP